MNNRAIINSHMQALIDGFYGCLDAACEQINARNGSSVCKGTLSRRLSGDFGWPVEDVWALEDGAGRYPVSRRRASQLQREDSACLSIYAASGAASKEAGEAVNAALAAAQSTDAGDTATAIREAEEGIEALTALRDSLTANVQPIKKGAA